MKLNKDFCVAAYKVLSRCATPDKFEYLKECDYTLGESVSAYAQALKEMVVTHTQLITTGEYDNNQLLRFNSVANRLLGEFRNGKISRLSNLTKITKQNKDNTMGLFNKLASLFVSAPVQATATSFDLADAKIAEYQAKLEAEKDEKLKEVKEQVKAAKEQARLAEANKQLQKIANEYILMTKEVAAARKAKEEAIERYVQMSIETIDLVNNIDDYVALQLATTTPIVEAVIKETAKPSFDVLDATPVVVKSVIKTPVVETPSLWDEPSELEVAPIEEFLADEEIEGDAVLKELYSTEPIGTRVKVKRDGTEINPLKGRKSVRPTLSADDDADMGASHAEGSAVKEATKVRPAVF